MSISNILIRAKQNANILTISIFDRSKIIPYTDVDQGPALHCLTGPAVRYFNIGYMIDVNGEPATGVETVYYPTEQQMQHQVLYPLPKLDTWYLNGVHIPDGKDLITPALSREDIDTLILQAEMSSDGVVRYANWTPGRKANYHLYSTSGDLFKDGAMVPEVRAAKYGPVLYRMGDCVDPKYLP